MDTPYSLNEAILKKV